METESECDSEIVNAKVPNVINSESQNIVSNESVNDKQVINNVSEKQSQNQSTVDVSQSSLSPSPVQSQLELCARTLTWLRLLGSVNVPIPHPVTLRKVFVCQIPIPKKVRRRLLLAVVNRVPPPQLVEAGPPLWGRRVVFTGTSLSLSPLFLGVLVVRNFSFLFKWLVLFSSA